MSPKKSAAKSKKPTAMKPTLKKANKPATKRGPASSAKQSKKAAKSTTNAKSSAKKPAAKPAPKPMAAKPAAKPAPAKPAQAAKPTPAAKPAAAAKPTPPVAAKPAPPVAAKAPASPAPAPTSVSATKTERAAKAAPTGPIHGGISDEAVRKTTGRGWDEWFAMIDAAGGAKLDHRGIVGIVGPHLTNSEWWGQMVTVAYEQARGLRAKHERPDGFQVGASRVLDVSVSRIYAAFFDDGLRAKWLSEPVTIKKATMDRSLRLAWKDNTPIDVTLFSKGESRASVAVQHAKLKDEESANARKAFWKAALDRLSVMLTGA